MKNNPLQCGAKTRSGQPCKSKPMPNGRCRMHGGTNKGTRRGERHALKHGIYSHALSADDQARIAELDTALGSLEHELAVARLQLSRALKAQAKAEQTGDGLEVSEHIERDGSGRAYAKNERKYTRTNYADIINRLLGRIESLEKTRADMLANRPQDDQQTLADMARQDTYIKPDEAGPDNPIL